MLFRSKHQDLCTLPPTIAPTFKAVCCVIIRYLNLELTKNTERGHRFGYIATHTTFLMSSLGAPSRVLLYSSIKILTLLKIAVDSGLEAWPSAGLGLGAMLLRVLFAGTEYSVQQV